MVPPFRAFAGPWLPRESYSRARITIPDRAAGRVTGGSPRLDRKTSPGRGVPARPADSLPAHLRVESLAAPGSFARLRGQTLRVPGPRAAVAGRRRGGRAAPARGRYPAHEAGVEFVAVDGAQSLSLVPVDVGASGVDFYAASPHKWVQYPKGLGLLYLRSDLQELLTPMWVSSGQAGAAGTVRRFEDYGTRNRPEVMALGDALAFQAQILMEARVPHHEAVWRRGRERVDATPGLRPLLGAVGGTLHGRGRGTPQRRAVPSALRGGRTRLSTDPDPRDRRRAALTEPSDAVRKPGDLLPHGGGLTPDHGESFAPTAGMGRKRSTAFAIPRADRSGAFRRISRSRGLVRNPVSMITPTVEGSSA
ncbi:MAG: aminotransferase class V-fold PLP-dependent enzyme [Gemmatimonadales bacterium]|nr:MAG: aminotransferase class V-fold PLP-dependent enzyme [Gemmatimonadales bacterium]